MGLSAVPLTQFWDSFLFFCRVVGAESRQAYSEVAPPPAPLPMAGPRIRGADADGRHLFRLPRLSLCQSSQLSLWGPEKDVELP